MPKIDVSKAAEIIMKNLVEPDVLRRIVEEMNLVVQPEPGEETAPAVKKQTVIVISDPEGVLPKVDLTGWVLQLPENESPATTPDRVFKAAYDFNASKKGRLLPVKTVGEAFEAVPVRYFKEAGVWVKTKEPVIVLRTNNALPRE